jgi:hypothetical protein
MRTQSGSHLVRQCDGNQSALPRYRPPRGRGENEASNRATIDLDWQLDLWAWQTHAVDGPEPAGKEHVPGVLDPKQWALSRICRVPTRAQMQQVHELLAHSSSHVLL